MRILVTGPNGFVGKYIMQALPNAVPVPSLRGTEAEVKARFAEADVVIHTAAISSIPECENDPDASYQANVLLPLWIAEAAANAKLVFFSSDQVYNGCSHDGPYTEEITCPNNVYARHKLEMEQRVAGINSSAVFLRPTWMYDMHHGYPVSLLNYGETAEIPHQYRGVTWVKEVASNIEKTIQLTGGAYNFGSENDLSMLELTKKALRLLGKECTLRESGVRHNLWMNTEKAKACGIEFSDSFTGFQKCVLN